MTSYYFGSGCDCPDCMPQKEGGEEVRRCGFCGRYFRGQDFLSEDETNYFLHLGITAEIGYCMDATKEAEQQDLDK